MTDRPKDFPAVAASSDGVGVPLRVQTAAGKPTPRKPIPVKVQVAVAIAQSPYHIVCPMCGSPIQPHDDRVLEHMVPLALGGSNDIENLRFVHKACADLKTNGRKATSHGSDKHAIAKAVRFDKINAGERSRTRKGPPLKTRGFDKTKSRKFNGKVVARG